MDPTERLRATYLIRSAAADIETRSAALAVEQSVEMPLDAVRQPRILEHVVARVSGIEPAGPDRFTVQLDLATSTIGGNLTQLVNMAFGNCSLQRDVELVDLDLDPALLPDLGGPRHGIVGLRRLVGASDGRASHRRRSSAGTVARELAELRRRSPGPASISSRTTTAWPTRRRRRSPLGWPLARPRSGRPIGARAAPAAMCPAWWAGRSR